MSAQFTHWTARRTTYILLFLVRNLRETPQGGEQTLHCVSSFLLLKFNVFFTPYWVWLRVFHIPFSSVSVLRSILKCILLGLFLVRWKVAAPWSKWLVVVFYCRGPTSVRVGFVMEKVTVGREISSGSLVSSREYNSTNGPNSFRHLTPTPIKS